MFTGKWLDYVQALVDESSSSLQVLVENTESGATFKLPLDGKVFKLLDYHLPNRYPAKI